MEDADAIKSCIDGEKDSFRFLVERYQKQAIGHATTILGNREDALDAAQEAFVDAYRAIERFDSSRRFYPWFYVLLRNRCFKILNSNDLKRTENLEETEFLETLNSPSLQKTLELETAFAKMSAENREILTLKYLDGFSYDELSGLLQIPKGTVMSRLFYARKELQSKLS